MTEDDDSALCTGKIGTSVAVALAARWWAQRREKAMLERVDNKANRLK